MDTEKISGIRCVRRRRYRLQPIFVDDLAELAVQHGNKTDNVIINAIGPETFTYRSLWSKQ